jgi:hypothetical protein
MGTSETQGSKKGLGIAIVATVIVLVLAGVAWVFPTASNQGYAPEQPIPFSHKLHAGDNKISCTYCHSSVEKSRHASIPSLNVCMNCHSVVKTDSPYIQQVKKAYTENKPIQWVRIHELPDYVYFSHKRHVAKGVSCETCHGDVKQMQRVSQFAPLNMGWCMDCHRGNTTPRNVLANTYPGVANPHGPVAPVNCNTCHN